MMGIMILLLRVVMGLEMEVKTEMKLVMSLGNMEVRLMVTMERIMEVRVEMT